MHVEDGISGVISGWGLLRVSIALIVFPLLFSNICAIVKFLPFMIVGFYNLLTGSVEKSVRYDCKPK